MFQNVGAFVSFQGFLNNDHKLIEGQCTSSKDCQLKACGTQANCRTHDNNSCLTASNIGNVNKKKCTTATSTNYRIVPANDQCIPKFIRHNAKNCNTPACGDTTYCLKLYQGEVLPDCGTDKPLIVNTKTNPPTLSCGSCTGESFPVRDVNVSVLNPAQKKEAETKGIDLTPENNIGIFNNVKEKNPIFKTFPRANLLLYKKTGEEEYYVSYKTGTTLAGLYNRCFTCFSGYMKDSSNNSCTEKSCKVPTATGPGSLNTNNIVVPSSGSTCKAGSTIDHGKTCAITDLRCKNGYTTTPRTNCDKGTFTPPTCTENVCNFSGNNRNVDNGTIGNKYVNTVFSPTVICPNSSSVASNTACGVTCNTGYTLTNHRGPGANATQKTGIYCKRGTVYKPQCDPNTCKCDNGTKEDDGNCKSTTANTCKSCHSGYRLGPAPSEVKGSRNCLKNTCTCNNGTAPQGANSTTDQQYCNDHNQENCVRCNTGYRLIMKGNDQNNQGQPTSIDDEKRTRTEAQCKTKTRNKQCKCSLIKCSCPDGQGHTGSSCGDAAKHNTTKCKRCNSGYVLDGNPPSCIKTEKCKCTNGTALPTSGDNQCPFSGANDKEACSTCNANFYKRRPDAMKDLDTIVAETTSSNGGVELTFLGSITGVDRSNIVNNSYTIEVNGKKLNIKIGPTTANDEKTFTFKSNNVQYTMKLPKTNDTVMKQPLNNTNRTNNARVLRNFLEKEYPAECKPKACTGNDSGKWRDFDTKNCHVYCSLNSNFTEKTESGKKVYSNKIPNTNIYKLTTGASGLANRNKRYFPVTSNNQNPSMSSAPIINNDDLNQNNYEITLTPDYWLKNPHDVNLKCGNEGKIDIVDGSGSSIITQCGDHPQCAQHKETTTSPKKKICGRYVTVNSGVTETQWKTSANAYSTAKTANKSSAWTNVQNKINKRLFQCSKAKSGFFLGAESTNNPFGTDQKYKYTGTPTKGSWTKQ